MQLTPDQLITFVSQFQSLLTTIANQNAEILSILKKTDQKEELKKAMGIYDSMSSDLADIFSGRKPLPSKP